MKLQSQLKALSALVALSTCFVASAEMLSPSAALSRAITSDSPVRKAPGGSSAFRLTRTVGLSSRPGCYLFDNGTETIVVSADTEAPALLGYFDSPSDPTAELTPALQYWLEEYARQIEFVRRNPQAARKVIAKADKAAIPVLCETRWNQDNPYNQDCPVSDGKRTYTGCVATSMAQVLKYFNYPEHGVGAKSLAFGSQTLYYDFGAATFDWANMLNRYWGNNWSETQASAVANLMYACGVAVDMMYGTSASGAYSTNIAEALLNYFNVDQNIWFSRPEYYTAEEWDEIVYDNLANVGPLILDGRATGGAHSFVCDGYDGKGYFHINWGWGGAYDGYFLLNALNPSGQGIGGYEGGYNANRDAVLGISKPRGGNVVNVHIANVDAFYPEEYSAYLGDKVYFRAALKNLGYREVSAVVGVNIYKNDAPVSFVESGTSTFPAQGGVSSFGVTFPTSLSDGEYVVYPAMKLNGKVENISTRSGFAGQMKMTVSGGRINFEAPENRDIVAVDLQFVGKPMSETPVKLIGSIMNRTNKMYAMYLTMLIYTLDNDIVGIGDNVEVIVKRNDTTEFTYESPLYSARADEPLASGRYTYVLYDDNAGLELMDPVEFELAPYDSAVESIVISNEDYLEIYDLSGVKVGEGAEIPATLERGIYIVKTTNNQTYKIIR